jgi:6,7-dimethyl-8-ribityllumazine synthase
VFVPGAFEIPGAIAQAARTSPYEGYVALGCVVRGETRHYEHVADECARGLMDVSLQHALPVANGVLAVEKHADAEARAGGVHGNKGEEAALAALEMAWLLRGLAAEAPEAAPRKASGLWR